jgi:transcriptional regulator NrdR family protein
MSSTNTQSTDNVSSDTITKSVMLELEKKAEIQVVQLASSADQKPDFGEKLVSIMSS